jgi:hypothetical protein
MPRSVGRDQWRPLGTPSVRCETGQCQDGWQNRRKKGHPLARREGGTKWFERKLAGEARHRAPAGGFIRRQQAVLLAGDMGNGLGTIIRKKDRREKNETLPQANSVRRVSMRTV